MSSIVKVFFATTILAAVLFGVIRMYLGGTDDIVQSMDLRSLAYVPEEEDADDKEEAEAIEEEPVYDEEPLDAEELPDRAESTSVGMTAADQNLEGLVDQHGCEVADVDSSQTDKAIADASNGGGESPPSECVQAQLADIKDSDQAQETSAEAAARKMREALGIEQRRPATRAVDVQLVLSEACEDSSFVDPPVSVQFRAESPTVRGASLLQLESLITDFKACTDSEFLFSENVLGKVDATPTLTQMRFDELKYFFMQRSVPQSALRFPESL